MARKKKLIDYFEDAILNYQILNKTSYVPSDEIFSIVKNLVTIPDHNTLIDRYVATRVSGLIKQMKNKDGTRRYLSNGNGSYSHIENERDVENLDGVLNQLNKKIDGMNKNVSKVEQQKFIAKNQITMNQILKSERGIK